MKIFKHNVAVFFLTVSFCQFVYAQEDRKVMVPLPSINDFTNGDGWGFGLGLGVEYESAYEGSDEFEVEADLAGGIQWRSGNNMFFFAGEAVGWRGLRNDTWLLQATLAFEEGREESDSDEGRLDGLGDTEESTELVFEVRKALDSDWRYWFDGRLLAGDEGNFLLLGGGMRFGSQNDGSGSELGVGITFHDEDYANREFGINAEQSSASGLAETDLDGGFRSIGINYNYRHYLNEHWQIFAEAVYEHYGSDDIKDSPITRSNYEAEVGVGFIYIF
jgi:outer membrane scaffolding protein for murein synthesis (MipA/OmpV family)